MSALGASTTSVASPPVSSKRKGPSSKKAVITPPTAGLDDSLSKRMTVERGVVDELLLVCGVIGTAHGDDLVPVADCLNWLQDLQRALRRDDDAFRPVSLLLGDWRVVPQKLLPLVTTCRYDTPMLLTIVKILVILTKPMGEAAKRNGRMAIDAKKSSPESVREQMKLRENALAQNKMLLDLKRAVTHHLPSSKNRKSGGGGLLSIFVSLLAEPISKTVRSDADHLTIELVLHLFRNLLAAEPLLSTSGNAAAALQLHHELVCLFETELVLDVLLVIAQDMESRENQNYNLLLMELLNLLFKSHDPRTVARCGRSVAAAATTGAKSTRENLPQTCSVLRDLLQKEKQKVQTKVSSRHSHFGGTLVVNRSDGKRQYVSAMAMASSSTASCTNNNNNTTTTTTRQAKKRRSRKREAFVGRVHQRQDSSSPAAARAQQAISRFCQRFVKDCYGPLVKSLKNEFRRDSVRLEEGDVAVFFRLAWFFCQWNRLSKSRDAPGHLIFTMDVFTFKLVVTSMDTYQQQKKYPELAQTTALYSEMMHLLHTMYHSKDSTEQIMALGLMDTLFYGQEPLDRLPKLLAKWQPGTSTHQHLCDIVEIVHMTLKLLEVVQSECGVSDGSDHHAPKKKKKNRNQSASADAVARMKANAADFDVAAYVLKKVASSAVVGMYTHLLSQYAINAPHANHRILAFFLRLQELTLAAQEDGCDGNSHHPLLATKTVTLEPMLYNVSVLMVLNEILNDGSIRADKNYSHLVSFATRLMCSFADHASAMPLAYCEALFSSTTTAPLRFCEDTANHYVNEELRMIAERELLMEEDEERQESNNMVEDEDVEFDDNEDDESVMQRVVDEDTHAAPLALKTGPTAKGAFDDDDEIEWDDGAAQKVSVLSDNNGTRTTKQKRGVILSDSEDDSDDDDSSETNTANNSLKKADATRQELSPVAVSTHGKKALLSDSDDDIDDHHHPAVKDSMVADETDNDAVSAAQLKPGTRKRDRSVPLLSCTKDEEHGDLSGTVTETRADVSDDDADNRFGRRDRPFVAAGGGDGGAAEAAAADADLKRKRDEPEATDLEGAAVSVSKKVREGLDAPVELCRGEEK